MRFKLTIEQEFETAEMFAAFVTNFPAFLRGLGIDPEKPKLASGGIVPPDKPYIVGERTSEQTVSKETAAAFAERATNMGGLPSSAMGPKVGSDNAAHTTQPEISGDETAAAELPAALSPRADETGGSLTPESDAVSPAAPRRRRGRPSKATAETTQPVAQTPIVEQPKPAQNDAASLFDTPKETKPEPKAEEPAAATNGAVTLDMVKGLYAKALEPDDGEEQIMAVHKKHGFVRLRECPAEKYAAVYASLQELIKTQAAAALV